MELKQIRTFVTVAKLGSVTKAANALHVTQPAVSAQLKGLEDELQLRLLARTTSSVELTQCGHELLPKAVLILNAFGDFANFARSLRGKIAGRLKIGVVMLDPELLRLGQFMKNMVENHRAVAVDLQVGRIEWFIDGVQNGDLDGALYAGSRYPTDTQGIELAELAYRVVVPAAWKTRIKGATWSDVALMPWIRTTKPSAHHEMVTEIFRQASIEPVEIVEVDHELVIRSLVAAGVGIGIMREDFALEAQKLGEVIVYSNLKVHTMLSFIYHANRQSDPVIRAAVDTLKAVWSDCHVSASR